MQKQKNQSQQPQKTAPPQQPRRLELSPDDLEKVRKRRASAESIKVDDNWMFAAELGMYYGWDCVKDIVNNGMDYEMAVMFLQAGRKVRAGMVYDQARANFIGSIAARSKKNVAVFNKLIKSTMKQSEADIK